MKIKLLKKLRKRAKRNLEIKYEEWEYFIYNRRLDKKFNSEDPRSQYSTLNWIGIRVRQYHDIEKAVSDYKYALWSETMLLFIEYKDSLIEKELRKVNRILMK
jgi:hypothetical protein